MSYYHIDATYLLYAFILSRIREDNIIIMYRIGGPSKCGEQLLIKTP